MKTKEELNNTKIWIGDNPVLSDKVQKRLFEIGFSWPNNSRIVRKNRVSLYLINNLIHYASSDSANKNDSPWFRAANKKEITLADLDLDNNGNPVIQPKFKLGDKVRIIAAKGCSGGVPSLLIGTVGIVAVITPAGWYKVEREGYNIPENMLEHYSEIEVGDTVSIANTFKHSAKAFSYEIVHGTLAGAKPTGKILMIRDDYYLVSVEGSVAYGTPKSKITCINNQVALEYRKDLIKLKQKGIACQPVNDKIINKPIDNENKSNSITEARIIQTDKLLSRIGTGEKPRGIEITSRSSISAVASRHVSYTTSIINS